MFEYLSSAGLQLHAEMVHMYWTLLIPFLVFLCAIEMLKGDSPNPRELLRRLFLSVFFLLTFKWVINAIATIGDAVCSQINGLEKLSQVLAHFGPVFSGSDSLFHLRETALYIFSLASYIVAYLGFFVATALTHFVWTILFIVSPLMILMYLNPKTAHITASLYRGLIQVVIWKVLWSILGVLLLKLALSPSTTGIQNYLMSIVMNLCIGVSMLFIPLATRSLISDGMSSMANALSMAPTLAATGAIKLAASRTGRRVGGAAIGAAGFATRPLTNPVTGRVETFKHRVTPGVKRFAKAYKQFGLPDKLKSKQERKN